jgi:3-hydroxyisobutyrate dehydrogenase
MMLRRLFSAATTSTSAKSIGFCGLGNMGASMASNLIKSGHKLTVYDVNQAATQKIVALGAQSAKSPAELAAAGVDVIVTMVPSTPHAREVYAGANGVFSTVKRGTLLIDSSTIDPAASRELSQQASAKGAAFVDAPVSGG